MSRVWEPSLKWPLTSRIWYAQQRENLSQEELFKLSVQNQANFVNFNKTDVVITTPAQFQLLNNYGRIKNLNPKYLVIDEADSLLDSNVNQAKAMAAFLSKVDFQQDLEAVGKKVS